MSFNLTRLLIFIYFFPKIHDLAFLWLLKRKKPIFKKKESYPMEFIASRILKDSSLALGS